MHTNTYTDAHAYTYIHACLYTYTRKHIYTQTQHVHIHASKHAWNDGAAATARAADADARSSALLLITGPASLAEQIGPEHGCSLLLLVPLLQLDTPPLFTRPQDRGPSLYTDTLRGLGSQLVDVDAGWCPPSLYTQRGLGDQRAPSLTHAPAGIRLAWVDEDRSDDRFLFIRNHSSKNPLVDMTMQFWSSWCCFLISETNDCNANQGYQCRYCQSQTVTLACVCCFVLLNRYWGIVMYGPGASSWASQGRCTHNPRSPTSQPYPVPP